ncbi:MAG: aspartate--tRNA(Asn) ligase [Candidatus Methanofastidiosia archaeon]
MDLMRGWVNEIRNIGGIKFVILRNRNGLFQITLPKKKVAPEIFSLVDKLSREDVVEIEGTVHPSRSKDFETETIPSSIKILSKAQTPLPMDPSGKVKAELDTRLDNRFLDIRRPEILAIFKIRHAMIRYARAYLESMEFMEVHTSSIISSASEGGTDLFSINYFEKKAYLSQSPQLYKQMMMAGGFDKIFEIAWYFRAEEHNTSRHLNESTAIDVEMSFIESEEDVMQVLEKLVCHVLEGIKADCAEELGILEKEITVPALPFKRISYDDVIGLLKSKNYPMEWGDDLGTEGEILLGKEMAKEGHEYYFIKRYPRNKVFYIQPDGKYCRGFDLDCRGVELTSGGQRCHEYEVISERIKEFGMDPNNFEDYLKIFKYGMPPHGGFGFGIERWLMKILDIKNIRECILFPRDRTRTTP